jgi:hypothetical protein
VVREEGQLGEGGKRGRAVMSAGCLQCGCCVPFDALASGRDSVLVLFLTR